MLFLATEWANRSAQFAFGDKARRLQIDGKSEAYVLEHFGPPSHTNPSTDGSGHVLVYVPCKWSFWPSYSKIAIDDRTSTVSFWMINSD